MNYTELVDETIENLFSEAHTLAKTQSGDISPEQSLRLDRIKAELTTILNECINQNL